MFLAKQLLLVALISPFSGHDEVDHFYYVGRLAEGNGLGVVGEVNLPPETDEYRAFVANYPANAEVIQPPLYHAILVPLYLVIPGGAETKLYFLRLVSIVLGMGVVWLSYLTARTVFPNESLLRIGVPLFVAFQPQLSFEAAIVNHDILLIGLVSLSFFFVLLGLRDGFGHRQLVLLGLIGAAGMWTKVSFALVLPVVALGIALDWWDGSRRYRTLIGRISIAVGLTLFLVLPWFARSFWLYGDPTGTARLRDIPGFGEQALPFGEMVSSLGFWRQMLEDTWGNYGWRQIPFDPMTFRVIWTIWAVALLGLVPFVLRAVWRRRRRPQRDGSQLQRRAVGLAICTSILFIGGVLYVGTVQFTQARFAFPAMVPLAILSVLGLAGWLPARARPAAIPILLTLLVLLNVVVTLRFVLPFYYGPGGSVAP